MGFFSVVFIEFNWKGTQRKLGNMLLVLVRGISTFMVVRTPRNKKITLGGFFI